MDRDDVFSQATQIADQLCYAMHEGRIADARALLPGIGKLLPMLGDDTSIGIEEARKRLGDLARASRDQGTVTWLTDRGHRVAAIVPAALAEIVTREEDGL